MPRRYKKRRTTRKRRNYRKKYKPAPQKSLLGNQRLVKFKYFHRGNELNPPAGGLSTYIFRANSLYDPDYSSVGHSVRGFDQLMTLYDHYTVIGSKITLKLGTDTGLTTSLIAGIALRDSVTVPSDVVDYIEGRNVRHIMMSHNNDSRTVSQKFSCKRFLGVSHPLAEKDVQGSVSSNPSEQAYFHLFASPVVNADVDSIDMSVEIEYIAILTEPKNPIIS